MVPFVGRQPELAVLHARMADALAGRPQIVQIQGPAGIGKTALLEHFLDLVGAEPSPPAVVRASGEETEKLLTYGVIDQLARSAGSSWPAGEPLTGAAVATGPLPAGTVDDPVTVGTRLLEFLDGLDRPAVVLAVDDAHWVDRPSLQALIFALRRLAADQVLAIIAVRDDDAPVLPESLGRVISGHRGTVLRLRGLDEQDLRDLAAKLGMQDIGVAAARRLRYGTQGNPLHARALLEEFPPSEWGGQERLLPSPRSFRWLVHDRYASCAAPTRQLVDAAAVVGPHAPLPLVAALAGVAEPLHAVDEAVKSDLLLTTETVSPWTLSFPHPLVRAAVYDALGPARRHDLHIAAAALVADESSKLRHRVAAAAEPDEALAADLTSFADREAHRQSWESAAAHLVSASRLSPDPQEAQRRVLRAVILTMLRGDAATATGLAAEIATYAPGPFRDVVSGSLAMAADDPDAAQTLLAAAWAARPDDDPELTATIALMTAIHRYGRLDAAATVLWCERCLALIPPSHSMTAVAQTYLIHGLGHSGRIAESFATADAAKQRADDPDHLWLNPRSARGLLRLVDDDLAGARADLESVAVTASRLGILNTSTYGFAYLARAEWLSGAWDDALLHAERAVAINLQSDFGFMQSAVLGVAVLVPAGRGDWAAADAYLAAMKQNESGYERSVVALGIARARLGEARGHPADVVTALEPLCHFEERDAVDEPGFWPWQDLYADALAAVGRFEEAATFLVPHEELAANRGRRSAIARLARSRGRVEAMAGRQDSAERAYGLALEAIDGLGLPFERARIELAAGGFLRRAGQRRRAADLLGAAQQRFVALDAAPYSQRCRTELAASGLTPVSRTGPDRVGLTSQELVVSRLAAQGRSNREIADELVVSIKTIEYHLRNAFAKLDVTSRRQLAARLTELAQPPS
jgi:DNA-binding CsgD family transcriptional regulator